MNEMTGFYHLCLIDNLHTINESKNVRTKRVAAIFLVMLTTEGFESDKNETIFTDFKKLYC